MARGLAALAVVVFHANASARWFGGPHWPLFTPLAHGVDFFFVLSGFIIAHVHAGDLHRPGLARLFVLKRAIRLLPLLWLAVAVAAAGGWVLRGAVDWAVVARSALLPPVTGEVAPDVVWTLRHEVLFYAVFAVAIVSPRLGGALAGLLVMGSVAQLALGMAGQPLTGVGSVVLSPYNLDFALGALVAVAAHRPPRHPMLWLVGGSGLAATLLTTVALDLWPGGTAALVDGREMGTAVTLGLAFAGILRGLVAADGRWRPHRLWLRLGVASYAVYLFHTLSNAVVQRLAVRLPEGLLAVGAGHLLLVAVGVVVGVAIDQWFDRPVRRTLKRWLLTARVTGAASPPPL